MRPFALLLAVTALGCGALWAATSAAAKTKKPYQVVELVTPPQIYLDEIVLGKPVVCAVWFNTNGDLLQECTPASAPAKKKPKPKQKQKQKASSGLAA